MDNYDIYCDLIEMPLHECRPLEMNMLVLRVPGGWVYGSLNGEVFVPFVKEGGRI